MSPSHCACTPQLRALVAVCLLQTSLVSLKCSAMWFLLRTCMYKPDGSHYKTLCPVPTAFHALR